MWTAITNVPSMREFINFERFTNFFQPRTLIPSFPHRSKFIGVAVRSYATSFPFSSLTRKPKSMSMALSDILQRKREVFPCVSTWKYLQMPLIPQEHKIRVSRQIHLAPLTDQGSHDSARYASPTLVDIQAEVFPYESGLGGRGRFERAISRPSTTPVHNITHQDGDHHRCYVAASSSIGDCILGYNHQERGSTRSYARHGLCTLGYVRSTRE